MKRMQWTGLLLSMLAVCLFAVPGVGQEPAGAEPSITVFAAASATDVLTELAKRYEAAHAVKVRLNFASSSVLAKQIEQAAPCDIFLSADQKWMDYLAERKLIQDATRRDIVGNQLVVITPADKPLEIKMEKAFDLAGAFTGRLAMGDPEHVPAGLYGKESLQSMGWWEALKDRVAPAENVRAALRLVEMGETDAGVVYWSDAKSSAKVVVAGVFPEDTHTPILYPIALCGSAAPDAMAFLEYVAGGEAAPVWKDAGFRPLAP